MSITAAMVVYNEEKRLENALKSCAWCDEIIVVDRNSTDRTREIAARYTKKIFILDNVEFSPKDNEAWLAHVTGEWIISITASDVMHPELARKLRELTDKQDFPYDVIDIPFRRYVLGLETPRSPWYAGLNSTVLFRKSAMQINSESVHGAISLDSKRHYKILDSDTAYMYHLTHSSADMLMDRHIIYWRAEGRVFPKTKSLRYPFVDVLKAICRVLVKKRTFLMGWDGVALSMAYVSYFMMRFVYIWEARSGKAPEIYAKIRADIGKAWDAEALLKKSK